MRMSMTLVFVDIHRLLPSTALFSGLLVLTVAAAAAYCFEVSLASAQGTRPSPFAQV